MVSFTILILHIKKMNSAAPNEILPHDFCISYTKMHASIIPISVS